MGKKKGSDSGEAGISEKQIAFSAQHGAIVDVEIRVTHDKTKHQGKRRATDARMFDNFTPEQERAFLRIGDGYGKIVGGMGHKSQIFVRVDRGSGGEDQQAVDWDAKLIGAYFAWHRECIVRNLDAAMALDIIISGMNVSESAQHRNTTRGKISRNLVACLNIYCWQHGWHTKQNAEDIADIREPRPPAPWSGWHNGLQAILKYVFSRKNDN